jgi:hypothetical protein
MPAMSRAHFRVMEVNQLPKYRRLGAFSTCHNGYVVFKSKRTIEQFSATDGTMQPSHTICVLDRRRTIASDVGTYSPSPNCAFNCVATLRAVGSVVKSRFAYRPRDFRVS